jgi:hypothetical protein
VSINQFIRHNFKANYEKILKVPEQISKENLLPHQRRKPVLADIEVMAINLTAEYVGIDSECPFQKASGGPLLLYRAKRLQ